MSGTGSTQPADAARSGVKYLCRDCLASGPAYPGPDRCPECGSPRLLAHPELDELSIAHIDCDAFYASVEKRDHPELADKPLIIGGERRGVVSTCCYIARMSGVRSAMPMFRARRLCPDAVIMRPDMAKYVAVSRQIRTLMDELTPLVQPISIDEAFLDLTGTRSVHHAVPAVVLAGLAKRIEAEVGVTISVGLSHNKFLAKISSELDKPRGFAVIGRAETLARLAPMPISAIIGVGRVFAERLKKDGLVTIGQLQEMQPNDLIRRYGETGARLSRLARGEDTRTVHSNEGMKSISTERTFFEDKIDFEELSTALLECCERLSERMKAKSLVGDTITLKLKTAGFRTRTRARSLTVPTQLAHTIYEVGSQLLAREIDGTAFRLIGVGMTGLEASGAEDPADLVEPAIARRSAAERAVDKLRGRYGREAVVRGKLFRKPKTEPQTPSKTPQDDVP